MSWRPSRPLQVAESVSPLGTCTNGAVTAVLVTGMSGTGKSTVLTELARRGHDVADTDYGEWIEEVTTATAELERLWRPRAIEALLDAHEEDMLFVAGCVANQGTFYPRFDAVVLLSAPPETLIERLRTRTTNNYGKTPEELAAVLENQRTVEPLLRQRATLELDATKSLGELVDVLVDIAGRGNSLEH